MEIVLASITFLACLHGIAIIITARQKQLKAAKAQKALPPAETEKLREWKKTFREIVVRTDGELSPELAEFLAEDSSRVTRILAETVKLAEEQKKTILEEAEKASATILEEAEKAAAEVKKKARQDADSIVNNAEVKKVEILSGRRLPLVGDALKAYRHDMKVSTSAEERGEVINRWHKKGFLFPDFLREELLSSATDHGTRDSWRKMFDQQDKDSYEHRHQKRS